MDVVIRVFNALINNLNQVEVRGEQNLIIMANSIDTLKKLRDSISPAVSEEKEAPDEE